MTTKFKWLRGILILIFILAGYRGNPGNTNLHRLAATYEAFRRF